MFTVYALVDPRDHRIRYVGLTKRSLASRVALHIQDRSGTRRRAWIDDLLGAGLRPTRVVLQTLPADDVHDEVEARRAEADWYDRLIACGADLTNTFVPTRPIRLCDIVPI